MHITSTINALTKSDHDIPVVLLSHNQIRKFIARPADYADLVLTAQRKFGLGSAKLVFATSTLDICRGQETEIDESAYPFLAPLLDEVTVIVDDGSSSSNKPDEGTSTSKRQEKAREVSPPPPHTATTHVSHGIHHKEWKRVPSPNPTMTHISHDVHNPDRTPPHHSSTTHISHGIHHRIPSPVHTDDEREVQGQGSFSLVTPPISKPATTEPAIPVPAIKEEKAQKGWKAPSGSGSKPPAPAQQKPKPAPPEREEEASREGDFDWQFRDEITSGSGIEPPKKPSTSNRQSFAGGRTEPLASASSRTGVSQSSGTSTSQTSDDARFNVMITGPHGEDQAEFKTRGKHTIGKVLAGACKTFGIDVERARLVLMLDADGEEHPFACGPDETMAQCGVLPNSKLVIEMEEEGDVDEDEVYEQEDELE